MDKAALAQVFSEYFRRPYQSIQRLLHTHRPSAGAGAVGQMVADAPSGFSLIPTKNKQTNKQRNKNCKDKRKKILTNSTSCQR
jgi:hypothetical protein